jgi:hypothetical protein
MPAPYRVSRFRLTGAASLWLALASPAHAQQSPMVQCRIGSFVQVMPDFACDAFTEGAKKLRQNPDTVYDCVKESGRHMQASLEARMNVCQTIWGLVGQFQK